MGTREKIEKVNGEPENGEESLGSRGVQKDEINSDSDHIGERRLARKIGLSF